MLSPTETLKRCKTPAPQCSAAGAVSAGWAGGYCPSQGTLVGNRVVTLGWAECAGKKLPFPLQAWLENWDQFGGG